MKLSFYTRHSLVVFACFLFVTPWIVTSARLALQQSSNRVADWLPVSFDATQRLRWFQQHFSADDLLMISWEGCDLEDPRLPQLAARLRAPVDIGNQRQVKLSRQIITGPEVLEQLQGEPLLLSRRAAQLRLRGWLTGDELESTCLVLLVTPEGWKNRHFLIEHIRDCADQIEGLARKSLRMAGTAMDSVAIDYASEKHLQWMMLGSFAVGCLLLAFLFKSVVLTGMVFFTALFCQQLSMALVHSTGGHMDSVMLMIPSLIYVLSISTGVHLAHYYLSAARDEGIEHAVERAVKKALLPCGLATLTTMIGLGSLTVSLLKPVSNFGGYAAMGVLLASVSVFFLLPSLLASIPISQQAYARKSSDRWDRLLTFVSTWSTPILLATTVVFGASLWGVFHFRSSACVHAFFAPDAPIIQDYDWLEERIGPLVPLEVVLRFPLDEETIAASPLDRLRVVGAVHGVLAENESVGAVVSALNFSRQIRHRGTGILQVSREALFNQQLGRNLETFRTMGFFRKTPTEQLWRVSSRAFAGHGLNYSMLLQELQAAVDPILERNRQRGLGEIEAVYCGGVPLVQQAQSQMLVDLANSFGLAFALIAAIMIAIQLAGSSEEFAVTRGWKATGWLILRRVTAGLISMIPNVFPCLLVLGAMGLAGIKLEIGSLMTASVALGIAVDDTLHFITWFRRGLARGDSQFAAIRFAYASCGVAMIQTTLACGLGLLTFAMSDFIPIARFAWVMFAMLSSAVVADLVVLPAVLLSPLGVVFEPLAPVERERTGGQGPGA
ncbi:MAG: MMPL family transporter [Pirellulales bacterium]|nr:MMPL family transporter [Pirellulales bacterium]